MSSVAETHDKSPAIKSRMFQSKKRYRIIILVGIILLSFQLFHSSSYTLRPVSKHVRRDACPPGFNKQSCSSPLNITTTNPQECETNLKDGALMFSRKNPHARPILLWLSLTNSSESWGRHHLRQRNINDFLSLISSQYNPAQTSLGLLTSDVHEYNRYIEATQAYDFAKVSIIWHPGFQPSNAVNRKNRQQKEIQVARRSEIARLRNFLMLKALDEEDHIMWSDADVYKFDKDIVRHMLKQSNERQDIGMITARCSLGGNDNYDHNAWRGTREGPRGWDLDQSEIDAGEKDKQGQYHVPAIIQGSNDDDLVELDVVGATILYMRAALIFQGLTFPDQFVVGTRWQKNGWDGIESEGLCYRSRHMSGGKCFVLGGSWHVEHTKS